MNVILSLIHFIFYLIFLMESLDESKINEELKQQSGQVNKVKRHKINSTELPELRVVFESDTEFKTLCKIPYWKKHKTKNEVVQGNSDLNSKATVLLPQSVYGLVKVNLYDHNYQISTGIIIGPNLVLTGADILCDDKTNHKLESIVFIPGLNGSDAPFGVCNIVDFFIPKDFLTINQSEDYALLVLEHPIGIQTGFIGLHASNDKRIQSKILSIAGYSRIIGDRDEKNEIIKTNFLPAARFLRKILFY